MAQLFETENTPSAVAYAKVALEQGIDAGDGLTYAVPPMLEDLQVGERVTVPLGRKNKAVSGYVMQIENHCDLPPSKVNKLKAITSRDASAVSLTPDLIALARWMAAYYCCPLGMVLVTMLPAAVKHGTGTVRQTMVGYADQVDGEEDSADAPKLTKLQRAVVEEVDRLAGAGQPWTEIKELADLAGAKTVSPIRQLIKKGVLTTQTQSAIRAAELIESARGKQGTGQPSARLVLTPDQDKALTHLGGHIPQGFSVNLLQGVTGSGKTEVYLRAIESLIGNTESKTNGAIVLVPEIALTPQTSARFRDRFGEDVAVLHSGLTASQRHAQWRRIRNGEVRIVVGARSAVFAPLSSVGLIIVDEEHDSSYKQDQLPRYQARDVAIKRAQLCGAAVVLGSATPSIESYYNATEKNTYHRLILPQRVSGLSLPKVDIVDLTDERRKRYQMTGKAGVHLLSLVMETAIRRTLEDKRQTLLLLNRRGYANYIACPDHNCGWLMYCDFCDALMVYHKAKQLPTGGYVECHHCTAKQTLPTNCPQCSKKITTFGLGTQRVEEELERKFPQARLARMDSDIMRTARDYEETLDAFRAGEIDILLGTQMIAKGLDFPNVRLVGVISADTSIHMPDFRATERTFQLISQVAGRTGRGSEAGKVILQTFNPNDPAIQLAAKHDYETFAQNEIELRRNMRLPPITRMARIVVRDKDHVACYEHATKLASSLNRFNDELQLGVRLRGPMACPIARIAEFHRMQIELIAADAATLQQLMTALRNQNMLISDHHTAVDVDPVSLL